MTMADLGVVGWNRKREERRLSLERTEPTSKHDRWARDCGD